MDSESVHPLFWEEWGIEAVMASNGLCEICTGAGPTGSCHSRCFSNGLCWLGEALICGMFQELEDLETIQGYS